MQLPPLKPPNVYTGYKILVSPGTSIRDPKAPFIPHPDSKLLAFELEIIDLDARNTETVTRTFFLPVSTILSRLQITTAGNYDLPSNGDLPTDERSMTILPWAAWGQDTRLLFPHTSLIYSMCDSCAVVSELPILGEELEVISLYDFATLPSLLADAEYLRQNPGMYPDLPSAIPPPLPHDPDDVFATKVVSAAPFRRAFTDFGFEDRGELDVILYEDGVCVFDPDTDSP